MNIVNVAQAADIATTQVGVNMNAWHAVMSASLIVQVTLLALATMSVISWAIIFAKRKIFNHLSEHNALFATAFRKTDSLDKLFENFNRFAGSPFARVFKAGYLELQSMAESLPPVTNEKNPPLLSGSDNIQRALNRAIESEILLLESRLSFLATVGSTGPFIGLFGTVWGIMGSFQQIGNMKSASLAVVAPGISEALIATAIGLAAAIPAVIAYNHFLNRLKREEIAINSFAADYLNIIKRNFFKDK